MPIRPPFRASTRRRQRFNTKRKRERAKTLTQLIWKQQQAIDQQACWSLRAIEQKIKNAYGFIADPTKTVNHNVQIALQQMPIWYYFSRPTNFAFHDLTTTIKPPPGLHKILGLSLKFIPTPQKTHAWTDIQASTYDRFDRDLRVCIFCIGHMEPKQPIALELYAHGREEELDAALAMQKVEYNPRMYIRSKWKPPEHMIPAELDKRLKRLKTELKAKFIHQRKCSSNLLPHQRRTL